MRQLKIIKSITDRKAESLDRYLNDVSREEMVDTDEEVVLARRIKLGDQEALDKMVTANLRFVISVAKQYQNQGLTLSDLICEGNIGLIKAAQRFDETRGFKFISYAVWWIRRSVIEAIMEHSRMVRLPQSKIDLLNKINRVSATLEQELDREPTAEEISEVLEIPIEKIEMLQHSARSKVSLDAPIGEDGDASLADLISDDSAPHTDDKLMRDSLRYDVEHLLCTLNEREKAVLKNFFGFDGDYFCLEEMAVELGISPERVRQIKERALIRLRHSSLSGGLRKYLA